jgi:hypothetical protein
MAEQYIVKTHKKKKTKEEVSITYRIDADFVPEKIADISPEFIENYCVANNEVEWLVATYNTKEYPVKRKNKETKKEYIEIVNCEADGYPFICVRKDFVNKFFPTIIKGKPAKEETNRERINRLYGKK